MVSIRDINSAWREVDKDFSIFLGPNKVNGIVINSFFCAFDGCRKAKSTASIFFVGWFFASQAEESEYYVGKNGFSKIMRLHMRRRVNWWRCSARYRSTSSALCQKGRQEKESARSRPETRPIGSQGKAYPAHGHQDRHRLCANRGHDCTGTTAHSAPGSSLYPNSLATDSCT